MDQQQSLKALVAQGLQALMAGSEVAKRATGEIQNDASAPELQEFLRQGEQQSQRWERRIARALEEIGPESGDGTDENPVLEAHYEVSRKIRGSAKDEFSRDLGIVASGQLALHYWIASMGTLRTYAQHLGMQQVAQELQSSLDEAKEADSRYTEIAEGLLGRRGMGQGDPPGASPGIATPS